MERRFLEQNQPSDLLDRLSPGPWIVLFLSGLLFVLQLFSGTSPAYAALIFLFNLLSVAMIGSLGGLRSLNGALLTVVCAKVVWFSQIVKVFLWEAADSNLFRPIETPLVMVLAIVAIGAAAHVLARMRVEPLLPRYVRLRGSELTAGLVASAIGLLSWLVVRIDVPGSPIYGIASYAQPAMGLGSVLVTAHYINSSNRRRSVGPASLVALFLPLLAGVLASTKFLMFQPILAYLLTCVYYRFRFSGTSLAALAVSAVVAVTILAPLAQVGRYNISGTTLSENLESTVDLIDKVLFDPETAQSLQELANPEGSFNPEAVYYVAEVGLINRFSLIGSADRLIDATLRTGTEGIAFALVQIPIIPRSFFGEASDELPNHYLGYKSGLVSIHDERTSIAFGVFADAFAVEGWLGTVVLCFVSFFLLFLAHRLVSDWLPENPFPVYLLLFLQHSLAEATVGYTVFYVIRMLPVHIAIFATVVWISNLLTSSADRRLA